MRDWTKAKIHLRSFPWPAAPFVRVLLSLTFMGSLAGVQRTAVLSVGFIPNAYEKLTVDR